MKTIACYTLGCKVNQYDTQAMRELFEAAGYQSVDFHADADVYLINTCTVTGTGDQKSLKLIRRIHREHPNSSIIVCGCLAQRDQQILMLEGVLLIVGVRQRAQVVELYERAVCEGVRINAVPDERDWTFEYLSVNRHEGKTRAVMKIQEGCDRYCAYCIIPSVRGPLRYMPIDGVKKQAIQLAAQRYKEIVVTGIHLASYGRGIEGVGHSENESRPALIDAIRAVHDTEGIARVRLGSLEPILITADFVGQIAELPKLCGQFHLSMQSGSGSVLKRMRRRYSPDEYYEAVVRLRTAFPDCAITTDVLTGFPGETDQEAQQTYDFVGKVGFARIHVFPYSRRVGTVANDMEGQVPEQIKKQRTAALIALGNQLEAAFVKNLVGKCVTVLMEEAQGGGLVMGYSPQYVRVISEGRPGEIADVLIDRTEGGTAYGHVRKDD